MIKLLIFLLVFCFPILWAQNRIFYHHYTTDEGLPSNTIYDIKESPDGVIALGTDNGLAFFNGQNFKNYNIQDGLDKPFTIALRYESNGDLLIGNYMGKLQRMRGNRFIILPENCESIDEIAFRNKQLFLKSFDNNYNPTTKGGTLGIFYRNFVPEKPIQNYSFDYSGFYKQQISSNITFVKDAVFSVNNQQEPVFIENRVIKTNRISLKIPDEIPSVFKAIKKDNTILLFTNTFFCELNLSGRIISKTNLPFPIINDTHRFHINMDQKGRIWLNLQTKGLFIFTENKWIRVNEKIGLKDNQNINNIFCDSKGKIWIATHENGLYCIPNFNINFYFTDSNLNFFNSFFEYQNAVFTSNRYRFYRIENEELKEIAIPVKNEFKLSTLNRKPVFQRVSPDLQNTCIYKNVKGYLDKKSLSLKDGRILFLGSREIRILENGKTQNIPLKEPKNEKFYQIVEYKNQWLCNVGSRLFFAQLKNDTLIEKSSFPNHPKGFISDIQLKNDILLIAENNQLHFFNNEKLIRTISEINGVKLDIINAIFQRNNEIWIACVNGLFRFSEKGNVVINKYNFLPDNDVQSVHFFRNFLFAGTKNGLAKLDLRFFENKSASPKIKIRKASVDGRNINIVNDFIQLQPEDNNLKVYPEITNYESPKNQLLEYRLDDGIWQKASQNILEIVAFPNGNHRLNIRVRDVNSDWNYLPLKINKKYPFYMTVWFWASVLLILGALIYYFMNQRIKKIRKKTEEDIAINNKMVELRQSALSAMMNPHFVFNSLNAIQYFVNTRQNELSGEYLAKLARLVRLFLNQSSEPYISLKDEISRLKMYVELEQLRFYPFEFNIELNNIPDPEKIRIPNMMIQPFIENAIIHGISHLQEKDGQIALNVKLTGEQLTIEISDNGLGLQENQNISNHISKGIAIIKQRLKALSQLYPDKIFQLQEKPFAVNEIRKGHLVILTITLV